MVAQVQQVPRLLSLRREGVTLLPLRPGRPQRRRASGPSVRRMLSALAPAVHRPGGGARGLLQLCL